MTQLAAPPKIIYLQFHVDSDPEYETGHVDDDDVTWCIDQQFKQDIEYVIKSDYDRLSALNAELVEALKQSRFTH